MRCCQSCGMSLYVPIVIVVCVSVVVCMKLRSTSDWTMQLIMRILFSSALVCCVYNDFYSG